MRLLHIGIFTENEPQISLRQALKNNSEFYVEYNFASLSKQEISDVMLHNVNHNNVDVIFLQIQTPDILNINVLKELKERKIKVFNFSGDVRSPLPHWYLDVAPYCYTLFTNENDINTIKSNGFDCEFFQVGYNECFYNTNGHVIDEAQIVFFGNNYTDCYPLSNFRYEIVNMLHRVYPDRFKAYGGNWNIPSRDMNFKQMEEGSIYRGAKLGINISHFNYKDILIFNNKRCIYNFSNKLFFNYGDKESFFNYLKTNNLTTSKKSKYRVTINRYIKIHSTILMFYIININ